MALLAHLSGSSQLGAPVMTSTNWKRPWTDVDQHDSSATYNAQPSQNAWAVSSPRDQRQSHDKAASPREWRSHIPSPVNTSLNRPSSSQSAADAGTDHALPHQHKQEAFTPSKRLCVEATHPRQPSATQEESVGESRPDQGTPPSSTPLPSLERKSPEQNFAGQLEGTLPEAWKSSNSDNSIAWTGRSRTMQEKGFEPAPTGQGQCTTCNKAFAKAPRIADGLSRLHNELATLWSSSSQPTDKPPSTMPDKRNTYIPSGLLDSLDWSLEKLNDSIEVARGMLGSQRAQEHEHKSRSANRTPLQGNTAAEQATKPDFIGLNARQLGRSPPISDDGSRHQELPPMRIGEHHRRPSAISIQAPRTHPNYMSRAQSPTLANQPSRSNAGPLPSPSSLSFSSGTPSNVLPPISSPSLHSHQPPTPSTIGPSASSQLRSPHTAHLQELQHQLSTKSLAHSILSSEHEKLLAAYSRSQTRCATLDRKSSVSETEIANLTEDRIRLQGQLELVEDEVGRLHAKQEEHTKHEREERDQWLRILRGSEELQRKWTVEERRWREDRQQWQREKGGRHGSPGAHETAMEISGEVSVTGSQEVRPIIKEESRTAESDLPLATSLQGAGGDEHLRSLLRMWQNRSESAERRNEKYRAELSSLQRIVGELAGMDARLTAISGSE